MGSIKPSGYGGRILKGDVLAHLGLIAPKPAPQPNFTAAPPRDQIVFAKVVHDDIKGEFFLIFCTIVTQGGEEGRGEEGRQDS